MPMLFPLATALLLASPSLAPSVATVPIAARPAERYSADVAVAWFELYYDLVKLERIPPPAASRLFGQAGVALHEAVAPGSRNLEGLAGQLNDLVSVPSPDRRARLQWDLVAHGALARMAESHFETASAGSKLALRVLTEQLTKRLSDRARPQIVEDSLEHGRLVAEAILAWSSTDGYSVYNNCPYNPLMGPEYWVPAPGGPSTPPLQPCWGQIRPMVLTSGAECPPPAPPTFSTDPASAFYLEALEVYDTSNSRTPDQTAIALFWADNPGATGTPPGHWLAVTSQLLRDQERDLVFAARAYARLGIAVHDAFIACWWSKYQYNLLRPVTYIRAYIDMSGTWTSFVSTPHFPEYTSGHSTQSGAAAVVLDELFGSPAFTDWTHDVHNPELGYAPRSYTSILDAALEAAVSRIYGGIHYRSACDLGVVQGQCIGQAILSRVRI
ncbi:MAG: vanadium-dependent haloperoxidase [Planctomycetes bacterium]|nr:vanadium-dependent haloperoxidase [Planctomycetota bacterium]